MDIPPPPRHCPQAGKSYFPSERKCVRPQRNLCGPPSACEVHGWLTERPSPSTSSVTRQPCTVLPGTKLRDLKMAGNFITASTENHAWAPHGTRLMRAGERPHTHTRSGVSSSLEPGTPYPHHAALGGPGPLGCSLPGQGQPPEPSCHQDNHTTPAAEFHTCLGLSPSSYGSPGATTTQLSRA